MIILSCSTPQNSVFFAGESFQCLLEFTCKEQEEALVLDTKPSANVVGPNPSTVVGPKPSLISTVGGPRGFISSVLSYISTPTFIDSPALMDSPSTPKSILNNASKNNNNNIDGENNHTTTIDGENNHTTTIDDDGLLNTGSAAVKNNVTDDVVGSVVLPTESNLSADTGNIVPPSEGKNYSSSFAMESPRFESRTMDQSRISSPNINSLRNLNIDTSKSIGKSLETIPMAYCQIVGIFTLDENYVKTDLFKNLENRTTYPAPGLRSSTTLKGVYGGGTLGEVSHLDKSSKSAPNGFPLYTTPPSILFCNLSLRPGESKIFKYQITIPAHLPPSHKGKIIKLTYKLVVGIQKGATMETQIVSIPFRLFARTNADGTRNVFDLLNPIIHTKDLSIVSEGDASESFISPRPSIIASPHINLASPPSMASASGGGASGSANSVRASQTRLEDEFETTTIDNVTNILQLAGKVSYDICKNNEHIAQLVLPRLSYKLGETITAIFNFTKSTIPTFYLSVYLECHEHIDAQYTTKPPLQIKNHTKTIVGECHHSTLNSRRTAIMLSLPLKATPEFMTVQANLIWTLRVLFVTGTGGRVLTSRAHVIIPASSTSVTNPSNVRHTTAGGGVALTGGFEHSRAVDDVAVEPFDCSIQLKVYGALKSTNQRPKVSEFQF